MLESTPLKGDRPVREGRKVDGRYPEYDWSNFQSEHGSHLEPILNTPNQKKFEIGVGGQINIYLNDSIVRI